MDNSDGMNARIGSEIRTARKASGITQQQLAQKLGNTYTQSTIGKIERGERSLTFPEIAVISTVLPLDLNELKYIVAGQTVQSAILELQSTIALAATKPNEIRYELGKITGQIHALEQRLQREADAPLPIAFETLNEVSEVVKGADEQVSELTASFLKLLQLLPTIEPGDD